MGIKRRQRGRETRGARLDSALWRVFADYYATLLGALCKLFHREKERERERERGDSIRAMKVILCPREVVIHILSFLKRESSGSQSLKSN